MNERIKELYTKAYCMAFDEADDKNFLDHHMEKFAELIVQECIEVVGDCSDQFATRSQITEEIKEHFGVEL